MFIKYHYEKKEIPGKVLEIWKGDIKLKWSKDKSKKIFCGMKIITKKTGNEKYCMENKIAHN